MKRIVCLLLALLLCGCGGILDLRYVQTRFGFSELIDSVPESPSVSNEARSVFSNFVCPYAQAGGFIPQFSRPSKLSAEVLILSALFLSRNASHFSHLLQAVPDEEGIYRLPSEEISGALRQIYAFQPSDPLDFLFLSVYYNPEYDRFEVPESDLPEPAPVVCAITDCHTAASGDITFKVNVYAYVLVDISNAVYRYALTETVGYKFIQSEEGYRLDMTAAYFKTTGVDF